MSAKRFYYHYHREFDQLKIVYDNKTTTVNKVVCNVATETKRNKTQPKIVVQGMASSIKIEPLGKGEVIAYIN